jgi:hypothetical protein
MELLRQRYSISYKREIQIELALTVEHPKSTQRLVLSVGELPCDIRIVRPHIIRKVQGGLASMIFLVQFCARVQESTDRSQVSAANDSAVQSGIAILRLTQGQ